MQLTKTAPSGDGAAWSAPRKLNDLRGESLRGSESAVMSPGPFCFLVGRGGVHNEVLEGEDLTCAWDQVTKKKKSDPHAGTGGKMLADTGTTIPAGMDHDVSSTLAEYGAHRSCQLSVLAFYCPSI